MRDTPDPEDRIGEIWHNLVKPLGRQHRYVELCERLETLLADEIDPDVRFHLMGELKSWHMVAEDYRASRRWAVRRCKEFDAWPLAWTGLAGFYHYTARKGHPTRREMRIALRHYETALDRARAADEWVRYILFDVCRLFRDMKDYPRLEAAMQAVLDDLPNRRAVDIPRIEDDWLRRLPDGALDPDLLACYREVVAAEAARSPHLGYGIYPATLDELGLARRATDKRRRRKDHT